MATLLCLKVLWVRFGIVSLATVIINVVLTRTVVIITVLNINVLFVYDYRPTKA